MGGTGSTAVAREICRAAPGATLTAARVLTRFLAEIAEHRDLAVALSNLLKAD